MQEQDMALQLAEDRKPREDGLDQQQFLEQVKLESKRRLENAHLNYQAKLLEKELEIAELKLQVKQLLNQTVDESADDCALRRLNFELSQQRSAFANLQSLYVANEIQVESLSSEVKKQQEMLTVAATRIRDDELLLAEYSKSLKVLQETADVNKALAEEMQSETKWMQDKIIAQEQQISSYAEAFTKVSEDFVLSEAASAEAIASFKAVVEKQQEELARNRKLLCPRWHQLAQKYLEQGPSVNSLKLQNTCSTTNWSTGLVQIRFMKSLVPASLWNKELHTVEIGLTLGNVTRKGTALVDYVQGAFFDDLMLNAQENALSIVKDRAFLRWLNDLVIAVAEIVSTTSLLFEAMRESTLDEIIHLAKFDPGETPCNTTADASYSLATPPPRSGSSVPDKGLELQTSDSVAPTSELGRLLAALEIQLDKLVAAASRDGLNPAVDLSHILERSNQLSKYLVARAPTTKSVNDQESGNPGGGAAVVNRMARTRSIEINDGSREDNTTTESDKKMQETTVSREKTVTVICAPVLAMLLYRLKSISILGLSSVVAANNPRKTDLAANSNAWEGLYKATKLLSERLAPMLESCFVVSQGGGGVRGFLHYGLGLLKASERRWTLTQVEALLNKAVSTIDTLNELVLPVLSGDQSPKSKAASWLESHVKEVALMLDIFYNFTPLSTVKMTGGWSPWEEAGKIVLGRLCQGVDLEGTVEFLLTQQRRNEAEFESKTAQIVAAEKLCNNWKQEVGMLAVEIERLTKYEVEVKSIRASTAQLNKLVTSLRQGLGSVTRQNKLLEQEKTVLSNQIAEHVLAIESLKKMPGVRAGPAYSIQEIEDLRAINSKLEGQLFSIQLERVEADLGIDELDRLYAQTLDARISPATPLSTLELSMADGRLPRCFGLRAALEPGVVTELVRQFNVLREETLRFLFRTPGLVEAAVTGPPVKRSSASAIAGEAGKRLSVGGPARLLDSTKLEATMLRLGMMKLKRQLLDAINGVSSGRNTGLKQQNVSETTRIPALGTIGPGQEYLKIIVPESGAKPFARVYIGDQKDRGWDTKLEGARVTKVQATLAQLELIRSKLMPAAMPVLIM